MEFPVGWYPPNFPLITQLIVLARRLRTIADMRHFVLLSLLTLLASACSSKIGGDQKGTVDAREIDYQVPPEPKEGGATAPGCNGVTTRGECQQNVYVFCIPDRNQVRRIDCGANNTTCVKDVVQGANCKPVETDPNGANSPCTNPSVSEKGYCTADDVAVFCDTSGTDPQVRTWDCSENGGSCNNCPNGERCCGGEVGIPCGGIDFDGICEGDTAKWCFDDELQVRDCTEAGQSCNGTCVDEGIFCCGDVAAQNACDEAGFLGTCDPDNRGYKFCFFEEIEEVACAVDKICVEDGCEAGAGCCDIPMSTNRCLELGAVGACSMDGKVEYCLGTTEEEIVTLECTGGEICEEPPSGCDDLANCCPPPQP